MSTTTFKEDLKGKLVNVEDTVSIRVYATPEFSSRSTEFINGPARAGSATGKVITDGSVKFIEVLRAKGLSIAGIPNISTIYLLYDDVLLEENPLYGKTTNPANPTPGKDSDDDVTTTPGKDRIPVPTEDGGTVFKKVPDTTPAPSEEPTTKPNKWLTYGLYAVLALGVVTIIVILVISLKKPKTPGPRPAQSK